MEYKRNKLLYNITAIHIVAVLLLEYQNSKLNVNVTNAQTINSEIFRICASYIYVPCVAFSV